MTTEPAPADKLVETIASGIWGRDHPMFVTWADLIAYPPDSFHGQTAARYRKDAEPIARALTEAGLVAETPTNKFADPIRCDNPGDHGERKETSALTEESSVAEVSTLTTPKASVWLIERKASDNDHAKWWHPDTGWMIDANKAMRLCRREDAEAYRQSMRFGHMSIVSEHVWIDDLSSLQATPEPPKAWTPIGWKLVPEVPTEEMLRAAGTAIAEPIDHVETYASWSELADLAYRAFIDSSPDAAEIASALNTACQAGAVSEAVDCHGLDTPERVCFYEQDFYVLSNFSAFSVQWRGCYFDTSEAAYHWEKFPGSVMGRSEIARSIRFAPSAHEAFKIAEREKLFRRDDWDDVKVGIMRDILRAKADQHEYVRRKLLATGDRELVENSWRDDFWGWGPNRDGQNMLGKLWMEIRAELRAPPPPETGGR